MDRDFIARNQIVERYFADKLPPKGVVDFERYCRSHPELLDELHVSDRVNAGLRLMEAGGVPLPWEEREKKPWERLPVFAGVASAALILLIIALVLWGSNTKGNKEITALKQQLISRPLEPILSTETVRVELNRTAPSLTPAFAVSNHSATLVDFKVNLGWSTFVQYRVTFDRINQGRALVISHLQRDSDGLLRFAINSDLLGPGNYQIVVEGITLRGEAIPQGWITIAVTAQ
jgi:hypothetical protein